jgi:hypothetical protein
MKFNIKFLFSIVSLRAENGREQLQVPFIDFRISIFCVASVIYCQLADSQHSTLSVAPR